MDEKHAILQAGRTYRHWFDVCGAIRFARAVCSVRNAKLASRTRVIRVGLPEPRLAGHCDRMGSYWRSKIVVALLALSRTRSCGLSYLVRQLCRQRDYLAQRTLPADRRRQDDSKVKLFRSVLPRITRITRMSAQYLHTAGIQCAARPSASFA